MLSSLFFLPIDNVYKYETRLFIADIDGHNLQLISGWESFSWSHFGWKKDDEFVIYTQTPYRYSLQGNLLDFIKQRPIKIKKFFLKAYFIRLLEKYRIRSLNFLEGKGIYVNTIRWLMDAFNLRMNMAGNY